MVLTPWVFFNKAASGQYSVFVNRVPSFNIFHGNQINTDGWRCYPFYGCFPGDSKLVMAALMDDARQQPGIFLGLQFKKIARLWSGVWNEYHYSLFGIQLPVQSLFHQLLLLSATFGLSFLLFKTKVKTLSREFSAALVLGTIIVFHFAYIPFEAISRYAITAMPAVILLSAAFYSYAIRQKDTRNRLLLLLGAAAVLFLLVSVSGTTANIVASFLPQPLMHLAPWIAAALACAAFATCFALGANLLQRLNSRKDNKPQFLIPALVTILAGSVAAVYTIQSFDWREWQCAIKPQQSVSQSILIPEKITAPVAFVLIDLSSQAFSPPVKVDVNGQTINEPLVPLAQFQPNNADILQCLAIQGEGMGLDLRTFRNWWVVPVKSELLKKGVNQIELTCADNSTKSTVYGDFAEASTGESDGNVFLPSLRSFSYTKGFTTFDNRDTRVFEKVIIQGKTTESIRKVASTPDTASSPFGASSTAKSTNDTKDLSQAAGIQSGRYRIRILVAQSPQQQNAAAPASVGLSELTRSPINLLGEESSQLVDGQNPTSFAPPIAIVNLPSNLPAGTRFTFSCQLRSVTCKRPYFVSVNFSGQDAAGDQKTWSSKWQPIAISPSRAFRTTSFTDTIPTEILELKNLQVHPMFSPFQPDFLFLKRAQALRSRIEIRSANLSFLPPLDLPPLESRTWQLY